jgi:hypothetical protein
VDTYRFTCVSAMTLRHGHIHVSILSLSEKNGFPRQAIIWSAEKVPSIAGGVMEELSDMLGKLEVGDGKIMGEAQIKINILLEKESPRR